MKKLEVGDRVRTKGKLAYWGEGTITDIKYTVRSDDASVIVVTAKQIELVPIKVQFT